VLVNKTFVPIVDMITGYGGEECWFVYVQLREFLKIKHVQGTEQLSSQRLHR
jgi:hypothetical protein